MIRLSSLQKEGLLQASKWLKIQVLLDPEEMQDLLHSLGDVYFVVVSEPVSPQGGILPTSTFVQKYADYVHYLKQGDIPPDREFRTFFSCALGKTLDSFFGIPCGEKVLIKPIKPVIQLQAHHFIYSDLDQKFHPMVFGKESISWGLQFSYPQLFQDPHTKQIVKVKDTPEFPSSEMFTQLRAWIRSHTLPTPFMVDHTRINVPIRIGKKVLSWISAHPQLKQVTVA